MPHLHFPFALPYALSRTPRPRARACPLTHEETASKSEKRLSFCDDALLQSRLAVTDVPGQWGRDEHAGGVGRRVARVRT